MEAVCYLFRTRKEADSAAAWISEIAPDLLYQLAEGSACGNEVVVRMIAAQTRAASAHGTLIAKKPEIDLLLRLAGTSQISEAIRKVGCRGEGETLLIASGRGESLRKFLASPGVGARRLPSRPLTQEEKMLVERAALLSIGRA